MIKMIKHYYILYRLLTVALETPAPCIFKFGEVRTLQAIRHAIRSGQQLGLASLHVNQTSLSSNHLHATHNADAVLSCGLTAMNPICICRYMETSMHHVVYGHYRGVIQARLCEHVASAHPRKGQPGYGPAFSRTSGQLVRVVLSFCRNDSE